MADSTKRIDLTNAIGTFPSQGGGLADTDYDRFRPLWLTFHLDGRVHLRGELFASGNAQMSGITFDLQIAANGAWIVDYDKRLAVPGRTGALTAGQLTALNTSRDDAFDDLLGKIVGSILAGVKAG